MTTKMDSQPTKDDIESVFNRLRSIPANKTCFDCNAKNPTWSSVTYGVFICIDCSAVHRSLGVHLTFVRSTQLDTNWTWVQLRQMQLGGNSNALQFFNQHNCNTTDAQKKYNSRAAQLYREKIIQSAINSLKTNPQLHVVPHHEEKPEPKEVDFFTEHENFTLPEISSQQQLSVEESSTDYKGGVAKNINLEDGPKVDFCTTNTTSDVRKSTIAKKHTIKKTSLGVKKSGLGATKVKTNFAEIEKEAELAEESRLRAAEESLKMAALSAKEQEDREAAVRLAYKDLSQQQLKKEEQMRKQDPKKAEQIERLGMGINSKCGISHSALSDMKTIEQESIQSTSLTLSSLGKLRLSDNDSFFDDFSCGNSFSMNRNTSNYSGSKIDSFLSETNSNSSKDSWVIIDDPPEKPKSSSFSHVLDKPREKSTKMIESVSGTDEAQKKFGNAKAISSDQFFNDKSADYETKANLSRFQGSSSISSAEFFGNGRDPIQTSSNMPSYDIEDVKESVRQGVTKVAGKIGSLANGWMSSIQDRYGY